MKKIIGLICALMLAINLGFSQELITGKTKQKFEAGDKVLFQSDFRQCPVGEIPTEFDKITGAVECVKYNEHIWLAPSTHNGMRLYKKLELGNDEFSIEFDVIALKPNTDFNLRLLYEGDKKNWKKENFYGSQPFDLKYWAWGWDKKGGLRLEGVGDIGQVQNAPKKVVHIAVMVRRHQYRVFVNGKRLVSVPFDKNVHGIEFYCSGDIREYGVLFSNLKVAKYTKKEAKPTPEKLGIKVQKTKEGMKLTVPERVLFDFNKFTLKPEAKDALGVVADIIIENQIKTILVTGYTDNIGSEAYNLKLSLQRAQSVADYLMYCEKIDPDKFKIEGKGEANPIADNNTKAGRAKNRRVEIKLLK